MAIITDLSAVASATPVVVVHSSNFDAYLAHADSRTRSWLVATGFHAKAHTHALIPTAEGALEQVLVGIKDAGDVYALSHLPLSLPAGNYAVSSHHDTLASYATALSWGLGSYQFDRYKKT